MICLYLIPSLLLLGTMSSSVEASSNTEQMLRDAFQAADKNADGKLNLEEFREYIAILLQNFKSSFRTVPTPSQIDQWFSLFDKDGDNQLDFNTALVAPVNESILCSLMHCQPTTTSTPPPPIVPTNGSSSDLYNVWAGSPRNDSDDWWTTMYNNSSDNSSFLPMPRCRNITYTEWKPGRVPVNGTGELNGTDGWCEDLDYIPEFKHHFLALILYTFCLLTVVGNGMVVLAVIQERNLHSPTNYFIMSLAVADSLVGLVVMPFSAWQEGMDQAWVFGHVWCDIWHALDVLASTASILHLCVISLDRYWAITDPMKYPRKMSSKRAGGLIVLIWICASVISFPCIAWWRSTATDPSPLWECPFTADIGYLVFSSLVSFYGPLAVMVFTYVQIFRVAQKHKESLASGTKQLGAGEGGGEIRIHRGGGGANSNKLVKTPSDDSDGGASSPGKSGKKKKNKSAKFAKENKAATTLGIVMGVFIICWLPFFLTNVISGICAGCISNPELVMAILTWLGWINSSMNPIIYTCRSKDFRRAFGRYLCLCCPRKTAAEQIRKRLQKPKKSSNSSSSSGCGRVSTVQPQLLNGGAKTAPNHIQNHIKDRQCNGGTLASNGANASNKPTNGATASNTTNGTNAAKNGMNAVNGNNMSKTGGSAAPGVNGDNSAKTQLQINNYPSQFCDLSVSSAERYALSYRSNNASLENLVATEQREHGNHGEPVEKVVRVVGVKPSTPTPRTRRTRDSLYSIPPPNYSFRPGVSDEKLV